MSIKRAWMTVVGLVGGLVLVEAALQGLKLAVSLGDAQRTAYEASEDGVRILCLGACYTVGLGTAPEQSYPAQLERRLDRLAEGDVGGATVYNLSLIHI